MRSRVMVRASLPSGFLNRIDEIIIFHALQKQELRQIGRCGLQDWRNDWGSQDVTQALRCCA